MVILPEIPQGRRTSPWRRHTDVVERILTIATLPELRSNTRNKQTTWWMHKHKHGMMHKQVWCMSGLKRHGMAKATKQYYKLSGDQYATSCILTKHHIKYLVLSRLSCQTILNVVKHGKRWGIIKTTYLGKFKWGRNNKQQFRKIPMSIFRICYCSALNHILILLNNKTKSTMLN